MLLFLCRSPFYADNTPQVSHLTQHHADSVQLVFKLTNSYQSTTPYNAGQTLLSKGNCMY